MELYERIRRDHMEQGWGIRRLAKEHRCHRREVRQALISATPPAPVVLTRARPVLGPWIATIDGMLAEDRRAPRKQRHTAHRIYVRLVSEFDAKVGEPTVRAWVRERRRELYGTVEAMVPQVHDAGEEAEVDLSEADVDFDWGRETVTFFQMRGCHSGAVFHGPLRSETQRAFLEGHADAFAHFGGFSQGCGTTTCRQRCARFYAGGHGWRTRRSCGCARITFSRLSFASRDCGAPAQVSPMLCSRPSRWRSSG